VLDRMGNRDATTLIRIENEAAGDFAIWIKDRKNRRVIPYPMEQCGYCRFATTPQRTDGGRSTEPGKLSTPNAACRSEIGSQPPPYQHLKRRHAGVTGRPAAFGRVEGGGCHHAQPDNGAQKRCGRTQPSIAAMTILDTLAVRLFACLRSSGPSYSNAISATATTGGALVRGALADLREGGDGGDQLRTEQGDSCRFGGGRIGTKDGKNGERIKSRVRPNGCAAE
jgi:hypothetical protein